MGGNEDEAIWAEVIFLDANIFLRFLAPALSDVDRKMQLQAAQLLEGVLERRIVATTSEVVLHEVCYILGSKHHYGLLHGEIISRIQTILNWPGMQFPNDDKSLYLRALDLWLQHPRLEFSDSVIAARCERSGHELATFDKHFADLPFLHLWRPEFSGP